VTEPRIIRYRWNKPQTTFLTLRAVAGGPIEWIDLEGAIRAGKSTPAAMKLAIYGCDFPGIHMAASRWSQDGLDAQIKPLWRDTARALGLQLKWHPHEEYDEILPYGSRVYLRALRSSDENNRYAKLAGLTLSVLWIDQAEEVPQDVFEAYVPARLSQPGFPHECWLTPNPPGEQHYIARQFPVPPQATPPHHTYIRTSVYDNRHNLGDAYIKDLEEAYPPGTALRRRFIDGRRGLSAIGEPVYGGYFNRSVHESLTLAANAQVPLLEAWDFGHRHPAVCWSQALPWGAWHVLGGVMGESMFLEDFAPAVLQVRNQWFGSGLVIQSTGDPAGDAASSQGVSRSAVDVLRTFGIRLETIPGANHPDRRNTAIQTLAGYMRRLTSLGPAFQIHPRFLVIGRDYQRTTPVLVDGFEAGYVWDTKQVATTAGSTRRPKKDGYYDHSQNCCEYLALMFGPAPTEAMPTPKPKAPEPEPLSLDIQGLGWMS